MVSFAYGLPREIQDDELDDLLPGVGMDIPDPADLLDSVLLSHCENLPPGL